MLLRLRSGKMHQFTLQNRFYNGNVSTSIIAEHYSVYITPAFFCPMSPRLSEHSELKQSCRLQGLRACSCSVRTSSKLKNKTNLETSFIRPKTTEQLFSSQVVAVDESCQFLVRAVQGLQYSLQCREGAAAACSTAATCSPHPQPAHHCMLQLCGLCVSFDRNIFVMSKNNFCQVVVSGYTDGLKLVESEFNVP